MLPPNASGCTAQATYWFCRGKSAAVVVVGVFRGLNYARAVELCCCWVVGACALSSRRVALQLQLHCIPRSHLVIGTSLRSALFKTVDCLLFF